MCPKFHTGFWVNVKVNGRHFVVGKVMGEAQMATVYLIVDRK
jgi:hypothetical protein